MDDHQVIYGDIQIAFSINYRDGLRSKVAIHVQPDRRVIVDAPPGTPLPDIKQALLKRARWVRSQLTRLEAMYGHTSPRQYVSGETYWYLGKRYLLKVRQAKQAQTKLVGGTLRVDVLEKCAAAVQAQLHEWYQRRADAVFARRLDALLPELHWISQRPEWRLRPMKKQWGSCSPGGQLSLNPQLVKAPRLCIDYVILHELCHLRHHNHSEQFYRLLKRHCPNWEMIKQRLDNLAEPILT